MPYLSLFKIRRDERWTALAALVYAITLNVLVIAHYADRFMTPADNYHRLFVRTFHISGFDPLTYAVVSNWDTEYNIYRHPLLAFFMYIPNQINQGLMLLTGCNCAQLVVGALLVACSFYAFVFLCRIFHEVVGVTRPDAWLLGGLTFSFAYVMVAVSVPDHFALSMFMLVLTLYLTGRKMQHGRPMRAWQTLLLFTLTAGISLNNGIKTFMACWAANGRRFWRPAHLLLVVALPSALLWGVARLEWHHFERPKYIARQEIRARNEQIRRDKTARAFRDTTRLRDTAAIHRAIDRLLAAKAQARQARESRKAWKAHVGRPIAHGEFSQWTDITTPRWPSVVENLFGEALQLHQDHLLEDDLSTRPVIVTYRYALNYVVEALLVLLFLAGVWCGRRSRFLWLALGFFLFDMFIHVVLGFGLNEVYIMSPHWLFVLTIAMAYLFRALRRSPRLHTAARLTVLTLALFFLAWNGWLYTEYLW